MMILLFLLIFAIKSLWDFQEPSPQKIHCNAPTQRTLSPSCQRESSPRASLQQVSINLFEFLLYGASLSPSFVSVMDSSPRFASVMDSFFLDLDLWWLCFSLRSKSIMDFLHLDLDLCCLWIVMGFLHLYLVLWWLWLCLLLFLSFFVMMCFSSWLEQIWRTPSRRSISVDDPSVYQLVNPTRMVESEMKELNRSPKKGCHVHYK